MKNKPISIPKENLIAIYGGTPGEFRTNRQRIIYKQRLKNDELRADREAKDKLQCCESSLQNLEMITNLLSRDFEGKNSLEVAHEYMKQQTRGTFTKATEFFSKLIDKLLAPCLPGFRKNSNERKILELFEFVSNEYNAPFNKVYLFEILPKRIDEVPAEIKVSKKVTLIISETIFGNTVIKLKQKHKKLQEKKEECINLLKEYMVDLGINVQAFERSYSYGLLSMTVIEDIGGFGEASRLLGNVERRRVEGYIGQKGVKVAGDHGSLPELRQAII